MTISYKIILFGKNGLLGSEFQHLLQEKHQLFSFDHSEVDITDFPKVQKTVEEIKPDFLINTAAYTNVDLVETEKEKAFAINAYSVQNLAKLSMQSRFPILHFSTDYVFSGKTSGEYDESASQNPINEYGKSKALGEKLLMENTDRFFLVRSSWLFGKNGKNFVKTVLNLAASQPVLKIVNDQYGKPTYSSDLANACLAFLSSQNFGIYHIVNEQATNWYEFAKEILKQRGIVKEVIPISSEELNRPAKRPANSILKNTRLPHLRPWPEALAEYFQSMKNL